MRRRRFLGIAASGLAAVAQASLAQPVSRQVRIGLLAPFRSDADIEAVKGSLRALGYVEGRNAVIDVRLGDSMQSPFEKGMNEIVALKPDLVIALGSEATSAAKKATRTVPILFVTGDPVGTGVVASLAHPGGNLTGISLQLAETGQKYLELLRELLPAASVVAVLSNPGNASTSAFLSDADRAAPQLGLRIVSVPVSGPEDAERAFAAIERARANALIVLALADNRVIEFTLTHRIPTLSGLRTMVARGLLMSYGPGLPETSRQMADYVDRVLKGARPADLPIQQPTKLELVLNLRTARAIGLTVPPRFLVRASEVIE